MFLPTLVATLVSSVPAAACSDEALSAAVPGEDAAARFKFFLPSRNGRYVRVTCAAHISNRRHLTKTARHLWTSALTFGADGPVRVPTLHSVGARSSDVVTGHLTEIEVTRGPERDELHVRRHEIVSLAEVLDAQAAIVSSHLEPSVSIRRGTQHPSSRFEVLLPEALRTVSVEPPSVGSLLMEVRWLFEDQPAVEGALADLPTGERLRATSRPERSADGRLKRSPGTFVFTRDDRGRVFVIAYVRAVESTE